MLEGVESVTIRHRTQMQAFEHNGADYDDRVVKNTQSDFCSLASETIFGDFFFRPGGHRGTQM